MEIKFKNGNSVGIGILGMCFIYSCIKLVTTSIAMVAARDVVN